MTENPFLNKQEGEALTYKKYLSTSKDPSIMKRYGGYGHVYLFGKTGINIEKLSTQEGEREVLYNKDTEWKVLFFYNTIRNGHDLPNMVVEESCVNFISKYSLDFHYLTNKEDKNISNETTSQLLDALTDRDISIVQK